MDVILFVEQMQDSPMAIPGMDLSVSAERKSAMDQARDLGVPVATDRVIPLLPTSSPTFAFLVFVPRYLPGADISSVEARRESLVGFLYAGFRAPNLFGRAASDVRLQNPNVAIRIFDGAEKSPERLMFTEGDFVNEESQLTRVTELTAANHTWTIEVAAPNGFGFSYLNWSPFFVLALGMILSFAVAASLFKSDLLQERVQAALKEADEANHAKTLFLANISHEIRTPLGIILGFAENALAETDPEKRTGFLKTILRNGRELARIIGDVLDLSKIEAKTLLIDTQRVSLKTLHEELLEIYEPQAIEKALKFKLHLNKLLPDSIMSDGTRIKQVLVNLLSNAFKFTAAGSIDITVERRKIKSNQEMLVYIVEDTGIGIPIENHKSLFRSFSQGDSSITRQYGGSGLGLAISRELAQALGGDLVIDAHPVGQGSRFIFTLPLVASVANEQKPKSITFEDSLKGRRILVVEDSLDNQLLLEMILKKSGVDVTIANNGFEGVKQALAMPYDLILMDIQMPVMDGYAAFENLKSKGVRVPVIALTAHALKDERTKALEMGFVAYLTKPIDRSQLLKASLEAIELT